MNNRLNIKGHSAYNKKAGKSVQILALFVDFTWMGALICFTNRVFHLSPVPSLFFLFLATPVFIFLFYIQIKFLGGSLGQIIWKLKLIKRKVIQTEKFDLSTLLTAILLTLSFVSGSLWCIREALWKHPLFLQSQDWELAPYFPVSNSDWMIVPFFYSMGAWPKAFMGHPVFYSIPYEKGPPQKFIGHIIAKWDLPNIKLTLEGPRTPTGLKKNRENLKLCLTQKWNYSIDCIDNREKALFRHIQEISKLKPKQWELKWFHIKNPALLEGEEPQGIFMSAQNEMQAQDRFIFMSPSGAHQTFILDRPLTSEGDLARKIFEESIQSQRISNELNSGRAWVDKLLGSTEITRLNQVQNRENFLLQVSEIQALLLAKISVDPKTYESYFHLGGTSLMLAQMAIKERKSDITAIAKPLLLSAYQYAQDISPQDERTLQLKKMWQEIKGY